MVACARRTRTPRAPTIWISCSSTHDVFNRDGSLPDPNIEQYPHIALALAEIDPTWVHPITGKTLAEMAKKCLPAACCGAAIIVALMRLLNSVGFVSEVGYWP